MGSQTRIITEVRMATGMADGVAVASLEADVAD